MTHPVCVFRRARRSGHLRWSLSLALLLLAMVAHAHAANNRWNNGTGSFVFNTGANWVGGAAPGLLDVAQFGVSGMIQSTYTVSFNNNATNQALQIEKDRVTLDLSSRQYTLTAATGIVVGNQSGVFPGRLTIINGTVNSSTNIDVGAAANTTGALIVGAGGLISGSPALNIGKLGNGFLTVQSDGDISSTGSTTIGVGSGITGTATIIGNGTAGSATLFTGTLDVGSTGTGTVNVQLGGLLQNSGAGVIGTGSLFTGTGTGTVNVMNAGSVWNSLGLLKVGDGGTGTVNITLGGKATGVDNVIGAGLSGSSGEVNVDGMSSLWHNSGTLTIGDTGAGTLNITNQGVVQNTIGSIGDANVPSSTGTVTVSGAGSRWTNASALTVGSARNGTLHISAGGHVQNNSVGIVGSASSGIGTVTVDGSGSLWDYSSRLTVGEAGQGTLSITGGGKVKNITGTVGNQSNSTGNVAVGGSGSLWENTGNVFVGEFGEGTLSITGGGLVRSVEGTIGIKSAGVGHVSVNGGGCLWDNSGAVFVGYSGDGTLEISNGGHVLSNPGFGAGDHDGIADGAGSTGLVTIDGGSSLWEGPGYILVGNRGNGTLRITDGGTVRAGQIEIGEESSGTGHVTVDGDGSLLNNVGNLVVGAFGRGTLEITGGGVVQCSFGSIDGPADSPSSVIVSGLGSRWHMLGELSVGLSAFGTAARTGKLDITDGGIVTTDGSASLGPRENKTGTVTVAGVGSTWQIGHQLGIGTGGGAGTLRIQSGGTVTVTTETYVSLGDLLSLEGGTFSTSQINFLDGAAVNTNFAWTSGTLHVGFFDGDLVNQAGILAPGKSGNSIGFTTIDGNYNQLADATLQIEVGGVIERDTVAASGGNAFLGGDLELTLINGFVPNPADTITILSAGFTIFNSFANVANGQRLATSDGLGSFVVNYGAGSAFNPSLVVLSNFLSGAGIPGDYNQNGIVDAADYVVWRKNLGSGASLPNDDTPGVGQDDYTRWRSHFGQTVGSGSSAVANAAIPEPAALLQLILVVAVVTTWRRRSA